MQPNLVDSHCHINFKAFQADYREVIGRCSAVGMKLVVPGSQLQTSQRAVEIAQEFENVHAAIGLHPTHVLDETFDRPVFEALAKDPKVVAIGETGLDRFHLPEEDKGQSVFQKQIELFIQHLDLAEAVGKPVIMHCREAYAELLELLEARRITVPLVIHCFMGSLNELKRFLALGAYVGYTGVITFANVQPELPEAVRQTPLDRLLIETDAPYLSPVPHRGKRNEPLYVEFVARQIAQLKNQTYEKIVQVTAANAQKIFQL